jgi:hypothetical protein
VEEEGVETESSQEEEPTSPQDAESSPSQEVESMSTNKVEQVNQDTPTKLEGQKIFGGLILGVDTHVDADQKLAKSGFVLNENFSSNNKSRAYEGTFTGQKAVIALELIGDVASSLSIMVVLSNVRKNSYAGSMDYFNEMRTILSEKYGEPSTSVRNFVYPYREGDGREIRALIEEKATVMDTWRPANFNGSICLKLNPGIVSMTYFSASQEDLDKKEREADKGRL